VTILKLRVPRPCGHSSSVRGDGKVLNIRAGARDFLADAGRGHVPNAQLVVPVAGGHQPVALRAEGQGPHARGVRQDSAGLAGRRVPQLRGLVPRARGNPPTVRAEGHRVDVAVVAVEHRQGCERVHVVYLGKQLDGLHFVSGFLVLPWGYFARSACHLFASAGLLIAVYSSISRSTASGMRNSAPPAFGMVFSRVFIPS